MKFKPKFQNLHGNNKKNSKLYPQLQVVEEDEMSSKDLEKSAPLDDVDFTSGFETQYEEEYRPLKPKVNVPKEQDTDTLWYRDMKTILVVIFLMAMFLFGTIILAKLVFTSNPLYIFGITVIYVTLAIVAVVIEVNCIHLR